MSKDDFEALAFIALVTAFACIVGMVAALLSHWLTLAFYRLGATESPAQYLAYVITFCLVVFVIGAVGNRLTTNRWPW